VGMLVGALGSTGCLAIPLRPLAAEKSTKKQRFLNSHFDFFLNIDDRSRELRCFLQKLLVIIYRKCALRFSLSFIVFEWQPCENGLSIFLEITFTAAAPCR
jgi:hypothetical protein